MSPEERIPDRDPVVTKSYVVHYLLAIIVLIGTLLWALWDESYGQRPWKRYQNVWKQRYSTFLRGARSQSAQAEKEIKDGDEYRRLEEALPAGRCRRPPATEGDQ